MNRLGVRKTFWEWSEKIPPVLVRLLAKRNRRQPMTYEEIIVASKLPPVLVATISGSTDWRGIDLPTMKSFLQACKVDFCDGKQMDRVDNYVRDNPTWQYLRKSPEWHHYEALIRTWRRSVHSK